MGWRVGVSGRTHHRLQAKDGTSGGWVGAFPREWVSWVHGLMPRGLRGRCFAFKNIHACMKRVAG